MPSRTLGYARVSTEKQSITRQIRNILAFDPDAIIYQEAYTGRKFTGRKEFNRMMKAVRPGDTIIFDSVSRMSRDAEEGFGIYEALFSQGVNLVFLKERHIDTDTYKQAMQTQINTQIDSGDRDANELIETVLAAVNTFMRALAKRQIELAFAQAEKEVQDLRQRTIEGIETARRNGKEPGRHKSTKLKIKKEAPAKAVIREHSKAFGGTLSDAACIKLAGISRNTYYKYKRELIQAGEE